MTTAPLLEARNLSVVRGGAEVLSIPDFTVAGNEVLSLIGPNGAGKSTLLLALARLLPLSAGEIRCRGESVMANRHLVPYRRRLAMVFQEPLLFDATVYDNVASGLKIRGLGRDELRRRVGEALELLQMTHLAERSARKLSGGEAQRTSLARAFAIRPELIFLDEPFSALDPPTRRTLTDDLERVLKATGTAAILATHDQMDALRLSDRMAVMHRGKILQSGPPVEVFNRPGTELVASLVGMENVLAGTVLDSREGLLTLALGEHRIAVPGRGAPGETVRFCIRPEHITLTSFDPAGGTSARNVLPATITAIAPMGIYQKLQIDCGFPLIVFLTQQSLGELHLAPQRTTFASFKATAVHLLRSGPDCHSTPKDD